MNSNPRDSEDRNKMMNKLEKIAISGLFVGATLISTGMIWENKYKIAEVGACIYLASFGLILYDYIREAGNSHDD